MQVFLAGCFFVFILVLSRERLKWRKDDGWLPSVGSGGLKVYVCDL